MIITSRDVVLRNPPLRAIYRLLACGPTLRAARICLPARGIPDLRYYRRARYSTTDRLIVILAPLVSSIGVNAGRPSREEKWHLLFLRAQNRGALSIVRHAA